MSAKIDVRWATKDDAEALAALAAAAGVVLDGVEIDWSEAADYWLAAFYDTGEMVGAIQVLAGKPFGRMEMLLLDPTLPYRPRGVVVSKITDHAIALLHAAGCQLALSSIPLEEESYAHVAERRGWVTLGTAHLIVKRLN